MARHFIDWADSANLKTVRCSFPDQVPQSLKVIAEPEKVVLPGGSSYLSPFTVRKYRANIRIVNYAPESIEDFSVWRRESEYDMLSDYSGGEDTDVGEDMRSFTSGKGFAKKVWEWRFWLQVEDASSKTNVKSPNNRLWLLVDNSAAQGLLGLDDDAAKLVFLFVTSNDADSRKPSKGSRSTRSSQGATFQVMGGS